MPIVNTREYGELEVFEQDKIIFKKPIFGFEHVTEYYLIPLQEPEQFTLLQSVEDVDVSFILTQPRLFLSDYVLDIEENDVELLSIVDHTDVLDFAIITIPENIEEMTMNILGPIVINKKNNYAVQAISNCIQYTTKCKLFQNMDSQRTLVTEHVQEHST